MKAVLVYDSVYGNTELVAQAVGAAIGSGAVVLRVDKARVGDLEQADLLIIGSPTHGSMATEAIRGLLARIGPPAVEGARMAAFDTRLTWGFLRRYGYAADKIEGALKAKGWASAGAEGGFFVRGLRKGPLRKGEAERAAVWAQSLVEGLT